MTSVSDWWPLVAAALFSFLAALFAGAEVALSRVSRIRVDELVEEGRSGAPRLQALMREPARPLNLLLLLRLVCEITASVLLTVFYLEPLDGAQAVLAAVGTMTVIGFVVIGVTPRTLGRQHAERIALRSAVPVSALTMMPLASRANAGVAT